MGSIVKRNVHRHCHLIASSWADYLHRARTRGANYGEKVIPWFLGCFHALPTFGGRDDGGRHPITIGLDVGDSDARRKP